MTPKLFQAHVPRTESHGQVLIGEEEEEEEEEENEKKKEEEEDDDDEDQEPLQVKLSVKPLTPSEVSYRRRSSYPSRCSSDLRRSTGPERVAPSIETNRCRSVTERSNLTRRSSRAASPDTSSRSSA